METWEYVTLSAIRSYGIHYRVNDEKIAAWKDRPLHTVLNEIGSRHFELVAYDGTNYIFKRRKASSNATE
jgi:hypothetical protein